MNFKITSYTKIHEWSRCKRYYLEPIIWRVASREMDNENKDVGFVTRSPEGYPQVLFGKPTRWFHCLLSLEVSNALLIRYSKLIQNFGNIGKTTI